MLQREFDKQNCMAAPSAPKSKMPATVTDRLDETDNCLVSLANIVDMLSDRLQIVITPLESCIDSRAEITPSGCPLAQRVIMHNTLISIQVAQLEDLLASIQL